MNRLGAGAALLAAMLLAVPARAADGVLVIAPHPDDEVLAAGGILYVARQAGRDFAVIVVTNGDYLGPDYGVTRQNESVAGLEVLGIPEDRVVFLGYPDGGLLPLWNNAPGAGQVYLSPHSGRDATYGTRGWGGADLHTALTGYPGPYNRPTLVSDLRAAVALLRPADIYTTGVFDDHPDHRGTFYALREVLNILGAEDPSFRPTVHTTVLHDPVHYPFDDFWPASAPRETPFIPGNDDVWPNPSAGSGVPRRFDPTAVLVRPPSLPSVIAWEARGLWPVPPPMALTDFDLNLKVQSLSRHASQASDVLWAHVKQDEVFWSQPLRLGAFPRNVAPAAVASATSAAAGQGPAGAIDGIVDGAPGRPTAEWAAAAPGAGATLRLSWRAPVTIDRVILYDRVSMADRVTAGRVVLDDETEVRAGPLANDGRGDEIVLPTPHRISALSFTVDAAVGRPGLAELEVFGAPSAEVCGDDADCDDGGPCTVDVCGDGVCGHAPVADGTACGDADACNGVESCEGGVCRRHAGPDCDDGDPCTRDACASPGICVHESICHPHPARGPGRCRIALVGVPARPCEDGDPACDQDETSDGVCRFAAILCVNGGPDSAACRLRAPLARVIVGGDAEAGFYELVRRLGPRLPTTARTCVGPTRISVALRPGARTERRRVALELTMVNGRHSRARVAAACRAAPRGAQRRPPGPLVP